MIQLLHFLLHNRAHLQQATELSTIVSVKGDYETSFSRPEGSFNFFPLKASSKGRDRILQDSCRIFNLVCFRACCVNAGFLDAVSRNQCDVKDLG